MTRGHTVAVRYRFAGNVLDTTRYELSHGGELVHVEPQVFDVLAYLVEHRDRVVTKAELAGLRLGAPVRVGVGVDDPGQAAPPVGR